jgi:hypothetical protein
LIKNQFNFTSASREFSRLVNKDPNSEVYYQVDKKTLQLRWTDVEIRKYRMAASKDNSQQETGEDEDEDLPPL